MRSTVIAILTVIGCLGLGSAQESPAFRAGVDLVPILVSITAQNGESIVDLKVDEIAVLDRGESATVGAISIPPRAIVAKILFDDTTRMSRFQKEARAVAEQLIGAMAPADRVGLATYSHFISPFTEDRQQLSTVLRTVLDQPSRPPFDDVGPWLALDGARSGFNLRPGAAYSGLGSLWHAPGFEFWSPGPAAEVRAIVIVSGGMDYRRSDLPASYEDQSKLIEELIGRIVRSNLIVFGLGFAGGRDERRLPKVSTDTGGWFVQGRRGMDVATEVRRIIADLRSRYLIGFVPKVLDGEDHSLEVRVKRPGVVVRAPVLYRRPAGRSVQ